MRRSLARGRLSLVLCRIKTLAGCCVGMFGFGCCGLHVNVADDVGEAVAANSWK
ncbi:hypothetical protein [Cryobacterium sp. Y57]|uniref:hypothetical protein n=1 Tax=Cryobacterium sp. Y57 TaxID=2048287 RepID=UPI001304D52D|nr:hypothetical protein [Cryobacterium sp. Y57]